MAVTNTRVPFPLEYFMDTMNIDPLLFNGIDISQCIYQNDSYCNFFWDQYNSGRQMYNREQLAQCLCSAFDRVSQYIGVKPVLTWECDTIEVPNNWFTNSQLGVNVSNLMLRTNWNMVKDFGQRLLTKLETTNLTYNAVGDDNFSEEATFTITLPESLETCDIKAYFTDTDFEIEPIYLVSFDEETREAIYKINSWNLLNPDLYIKRSWKNNVPYSCDISNFVTEIDVYSETIDICKPQAMIIYKDSHTCTNACTDNEQPACVRLIDNCNGYFGITPQKYNDEGCVINGYDCNICSIPYKVKVWYRAGCFKPCNEKCDSYCYCRNLIDTVSILAACCLDEYPNCECACMSMTIQKWQAQTSLIPKTGDRWNLPASIRNELGSGFGTKVGEIEVILRLNQMLASENLCTREL